MNLQLYTVITAFAPVIFLKVWTLLSFVYCTLLCSSFPSPSVWAKSKEAQVKHQLLQNCAQQRISCFHLPPSCFVSNSISVQACKVGVACRCYQQKQSQPRPMLQLVPTNYSLDRLEVVGISCSIPLTVTAFAGSTCNQLSVAC